ncbi:MAG TPA: hypothetical protein VGJ75_20835 [Dongiaceae bacterium]
MLQVLAFSPDGQPHIVGSAVIIAAGEGGVALALSARHVLEQAGRIQRPHSKHAPSALAEFLPRTLPSIRSEDLRMAWMGADHGTMLRVVHASFADHDTMVYTLIPQDDIERARFKPSVLPLDLSIPKIGDQVCIFTQLGMDEMHSYLYHGERWGFTLHRKAEMFTGVVTHVGLRGHRQHKSACFTISVPTLAGMSGSPVYIVPKTGPIGVCGVVSTDFSSDYEDGMTCGESVITCAWLSLAIPIPEELREGTGEMTIYDFMKRGLMPRAMGDFESFWVEKIGAGYRIHVPPTHSG